MAATHFGLRVWCGLLAYLLIDRQLGILNLRSQLVFSLTLSGQLTVLSWAINRQLTLEDLQLP